LAACGRAGERSIADFTGGKKSGAKQPAPAQANPPAEPHQAGAPHAPAPQPASAPVSAAGEEAARSPEVSGPAVSQKSPSTEELSAEESRPIREQTIAYGASHRKDPFRSLIGGSDIDTEIIDLSVVKLVGVAWDEGRIFCAVEDAEGTAFILHKGDRVKNGRVVSIDHTALVASQTILGYTTTVQLTLENGKDDTHG
jgi:hypothetical protein